MQANPIMSHRTSFGKPAALIKAAEEVGLIESINRHVGRKKKMDWLLHNISS